MPKHVPKAPKSLASARQKKIEALKAKLKPDQVEQAEDRLRSMPISQQANYLTTITTGRSREKAIKAMCLECVGGVPGEVRKCPASACPLHRFRPYK